jgi:hypothetical protein
LANFPNMRSATKFIAQHIKAQMPKECQVFERQTFSD